MNRVQSLEVEEKLIDLVNLVKERLNYTELQVPFFIAGGSVFASINNSKYNDIDVFLYSKGDIDKLRPLLDQEPVYETGNAISIPEQSPRIKATEEIQGNKQLILDEVELFGMSDEGKIQIIKRNTGHPIEVFQKFDINSSKCCITHENEIIIHPECSNVIKITKKVIQSDVLVRYRKYVEEKDCKDPAHQELKSILNYLLMNPELEIQISYQWETPEFVPPTVIINNFLYSGFVNKEIQQYIHDVIYVHYNEQKRIELFEDLKNLCCDACDEWALHPLILKVQNLSLGDYVLNENDQRIMEKYAEYFI